LWLSVAIFTAFLCTRIVSQKTPHMDELSQLNAKIQAKIAAIKEQEQHIEQKKLLGDTEAAAVASKAPTNLEDSGQTVETHSSRYTRKLVGSEKELGNPAQPVGQDQQGLGGSISTMVTLGESKLARKGLKASATRYF
jgi:hypothetical protein